MIEPLLPLIINLSSQNREYVVFLGAGFSKDAGVKSGWDILIETLKPIYINENSLADLPEDYYSKIENWFLSHETISKLGYSEILELIYKGEVERREYLRQFFEKEQPGEAHRQLALMVANGLIRFILTTNFDDLIEKALDELDIVYDVIYSDDVLESSLSWDKVKTCRIYKLHGDYKAGKVRNTIKELQKLEPLIADDFQYIIDRHGLIVIGYAGRDKGVMSHFLKRKPYSYPFYWQYRTHPDKSDEFKLYNQLKDKYKNKFKREINYIQDDSAAEFISKINNGIENLQRAVVVSKDEKYNYSSYIVEKNERKIRGLTLELIKKFVHFFDEYLAKEDLDKFYVYKFEVFEEFTKKIEFIFFYLDELLKFNLDKEAKYFIRKIAERLLSIEWRYLHEFMQKSSPYFIVLTSGAIFLKNEYPSLFDLYYDLEIKYGSGSYMKFISRISYEDDAWKTISKQKYNVNLVRPKYETIQNKLLPSNVSTQEFNYSDAFLTLDLIIRNLNYTWINGSAVSRDDFEAIFKKYFDSEISSEQEARTFIEKLESAYGLPKVTRRYYDDWNTGFNQVIDYLEKKFHIEQSAT